MNASLITLSLLLGASLAIAQTPTVPTLMSYQGRVTDTAGVLIGNTTAVNRSVTFRLYTASTGGNAIWAEVQTATISGGEFSVLVGNGTGLSGFSGPSAPAVQPYKTLSDIINTATTSSLYLGLTVDDGNPSTVDSEISPRQQIVSAAFSMRSRVAETVANASVTSSMISDGAVTTNTILAGAVNNAKIADLSVNTAKLADATITTAKIADANVTTAKLVNGSVTTDKILDGTIGTVDLGGSSVTGDKIADGTIASIDIGDGQVQNADLAGSSVDLGKLVAAVQQALNPPGTIIAYAGDTAPPGWFLCDGAYLSRTTYATLFAVVSTRFGTSTSTNFAVPDFRGRFLRGWDGGIGRDPDRGSRTAMQLGGVTGDKVGSVQGDQFRAHKHDVPNNSTGSGVNQNSLIESSDSNEDYSSTPGTGMTGGNETRPINANVNYIIKY
jgi:microcystin-dependent protein/outer membrane murein-binding lipoprotein Lpp